MSTRSAWCALVLALLVGCGRAPQVSAPHRELIEALNTATSARLLPWVEECAKSLEERKLRGDLTREEIDAFEEIIALARAEKWEEARTAAKRLGKAQRTSLNRA
ncbi:MAG TPA: hypothetical protein VF306_02300 [Pirellulales bacterium]